MLENKLREDLERLKKIRAHRGLRHYWGYYCSNFSLLCYIDEEFCTMQPASSRSTHENYRSSWTHSRCLEKEVNIFTLPFRVLFCGILTSANTFHGNQNFIISFILYY